MRSCKTLGAGYLPAVLLVLAGSLVPPKVDDSLKEQIKPLKEPNVSGFVKQIAAIYASRFVLMPLIGLSLIRYAKDYSPQLRSIFSDKLLVFILLLETCMPSAQNSTVILQLLGKPQAAAKMARVLLAIYVLGVPAMSFWISKILSETGIL